MKNSMHLLVGIVASLALALPQLAGQESARTVAEPHPRVELPRTLRLIDLHDVLLAEAAYPDIELPKDAEPADEGATAAQHRHELGEPVAVSRDLDEAARVAKRAVQWQVMLRIWMQPPLDADRDRLEMLPNGTLIANLTADAHAWLDEFLALQRDKNFMRWTPVGWIWSRVPERT